MTVQFSVDITPVPQSRPRFSGNHVYEEPRITAYKSIIRAEAVRHMRGHIPLDGAIGICICIRRNKKATSRAFGDVDNHVKSVLDALHQIVFSDDSLIVNLSAFKIQSTHEGIDIFISELEDNHE